MSEVLLKFYAIRNRDGKYMRSKGFGGHGEKWVDELKKAKIYPKIGGARSQVTYWANNYPEYGIPELIELNVTEMAVVSEEERVKKSITDKKIRQAKWKAESNKMQLERCLREKEEIDNKLKLLKQGMSE